MGIKVLLVRPRPHKDSIGLDRFMICEPLELEYLSSALEAQGHRVVILDMLLEHPRQFEITLVDFQPQVLGFTAYLPHVAVVQAMAREAKTILPHLQTVVGGVHAELVPTDFVDPALDFIACANGAQTICALARYLVEGPGEKEAIISSIPGLYSPSKTKYTHIPAIDMPWPDRTKTKKYRRHYNYIYHNNCALIRTSLGCPHHCSFCCCTALARNTYTCRDLGDVIAELATIEEPNIFIVDDNFLSSVTRVEEFFALARKQGISKNYILFGRADFIVAHPKTIANLANYGVKGIFVGLESFTQKELEHIQKGSNVSQNQQAVRLLEDVGIECYGGILADPTWTEEDFKHLIRSLKIFKNPMINLQPLTPMPGTPLYQEWKGLITTDSRSYELWDMAHLVVPSTGMETSSFYRWMLRVYFSTAAGPKAHWYVLKTYGPRVYLRTLGAVLHIAGQYKKLIKAARNLEDGYP